jgi:hypothetical protein
MFTEDECDAGYYLTLIPPLPAKNHRGETVGNSDQDERVPLLELCVDPSEDGVRWTASLMHADGPANAMCGQDIADGADPAEAMVAGVKALQELAPLIRLSDAERLARDAPEPPRQLIWCSSEKGFGRFVIASGSVTARAFVSGAESIKAEEIGAVHLCKLPKHVILMGEPAGKFCLGYAPTDSITECAAVLERLAAKKEYRAEEKLKVFREGLAHIGIRYTDRPRTRPSPA